MHLLPILYRDPNGDGGTSGDGKGAADGKGGGDKVDPKDAMIAAMAKQLKELEAREAARLAEVKAAEDKAASEAKAKAEREAIERGEASKIIEAKDAELARVRAELDTRTKAEAERAAAAAKEAEEVVKALPETLRAVVLAIPEPEARLRHARTLAAEQRPAGTRGDSDERKRAEAKPVKIPPEVERKAKELGLDPVHYFNTMVSAGRIKPVATA